MKKPPQKPKKTLNAWKINSFNLSRILFRWAAAERMRRLYDVEAKDILKKDAFTYVFYRNIYLGAWIIYLHSLLEYFYEHANYKVPGLKFSHSSYIIINKFRNRMAHFDLSNTAIKSLKSNEIQRAEKIHFQFKKYLLGAIRVQYLKQGYDSSFGYFKIPEITDLITEGVNSKFRQNMASINRRMSKFRHG